MSYLPCACCYLTYLHVRKIRRFFGITTHLRSVTCKWSAANWTAMFGIISLACAVHFHCSCSIRVALQVNCQDRFTHTPLWDAISRMDMEAATLLREAGGIVQDGVAQKICEEARRNNVGLFELLHAVGVDIYSRVSLSLFMCLECLWGTDGLFCSIYNLCCMI